MEESEKSLADDFNEIRITLKKLEADASEFTRQFQAYTKKVQRLALSEQALYPKLHAEPWFRSSGLPIPCKLNEFLTYYIKQKAAEGDVCADTRTLTLGPEDFELFSLSDIDKTRYGWIEFLTLLPNLFE